MAVQVNTTDSVLAEFSMGISKANITNGVMRFRSVNSDIDADYYGERMSKELFQDFIAHIQNEDEIPQPFKSRIAEEDWDGGMPYLSLSHYKTGKGKVNVPGEPSNIYLDGKALKSTGILYDTPLGKAVFKSLQKDLVEKRDDKVRISIGFLDLEHSHGDIYTFTRKTLTDKCPLCEKGVKDKIYKKGHLVHLALTRVPANPRTDIEVEKSMTTKAEDAKSIIEDEEIIKGLDLKSQVEDALVIKSEETEKSVTETETPVEAVADNTVSITSTFSATPIAIDMSGVTTVSPVTSGLVQVTPVEATPVEKSFAALVERISTIKSQGLTGEQALSQIQADFDKVGEVIKMEFTPQPTAEEIANKQLETTLRSLLNEMLPQILATTVAPMQSKLETFEGELRAKSLVSPVTPVTRKEETPVQRSLSPTLVQRAAIEKAAQNAVSQFDLIARQSVGLQ
jgi:hypothetical protein